MRLPAGLQGTAENIKTIRVQVNTGRVTYNQVYSRARTNWQDNNNHKSEISDSGRKTGLPLFDGLLYSAVDGGDQVLIKFIFKTTLYLFQSTNI
jgi:hypothetical protein